MKRAIAREEVEESLYDSDFYEWTKRVSGAIRDSGLSDADAEHVAEEIADIGKRDRRELRSRMTVLVMHLMKWAAQPEKRVGSTWKATIQQQRNQVADLLEDSPSLRVILVNELPVVYGRAARLAADETGVQFLSSVKPPGGRAAQADRLLSDTWFPETIADLFN